MTEGQSAAALAAGIELPAGHRDAAVAPPPVTQDDPASVQITVDTLNLQQALIDFEIANARVTDLTQRLVESHEELVRLRDEVETLRLDAERLRRDNAALSNSRALQLAQAVRAALRAVRRR